MNLNKNRQFSLEARPQVDYRQIAKVFRLPNSTNTSSVQLAVNFINTIGSFI